MDQTTIAEKYVCPLCHCLPRYPVAAEDGHFYHETCLNAVFESSPAGEPIISPATKEQMGTKIIHAKTIQCLIEKLVAEEEVDSELLGCDWNDTHKSDMIRETKEKAECGSAEYMAKLGRLCLFGEQEGFEFEDELNEQERIEDGYRLCKESAEKGHCDGMAYQAICLLFGYGIEKDGEEGQELLVEAAVEGSGMCTLCINFA